MKMKFKRATAMLLCIVMLLSAIPTASAEEPTVQVSENTDVTETENTEITSSICDEPQPEIIPPLDHEHSYSSVVTNPTCIESGYTTYTCECGDSYVADEVAALGHTEVTDEAVEATCSQTGLTEGKHCSVCGEVLIAQEKVEKLNHNYVTGACSACGEVTAYLETPVLSVSNIASTGKIKLTWNAVESADSYTLYICDETGNLIKTVSTNGTSIKHNSAVAGNTYTYYVVAVAADGIASEASNTQKRTCDLAQPKITASNIASSGKVKISWDAVYGATKYTLYIYNEDGKLLKSSSTKSTSINHTSAVAGVTYTYKLQAKCDVDAATSVYSAAKDRTCDLAYPQITVSNIASSGKVKISWDAVYGATKYTLYIYNKDGKLLKSSSTKSTSINHTSAVAGVTYTYKLKAKCDVDSATSAYSSAKDRTCDLARPEVTVSNVASSGKVKLTWGVIDGAVEYNIYRSTTGEDGTYKLMKTTESTSYTNTNAETGVKYYYKVRAIAKNTSANSAYSTVKSRMCDLARPIVTISRTSNGKPKLTWDAINGAENYKVYRSTSKNGEYALLQTVTGTKLIDTSAVAGKTYYYKTKAIHIQSAANSAYSNIVSIKSTGNGKNSIKYPNISGLWYASGHPEVTINFSKTDSWVYFEGNNFDVNEGNINHSVSTSTPYPFFCDDSELVSIDGLEYISSNEIVYTVGTNTTVFTRTPDVPTLVEELDGYYWYLDGYEYAYLYPTVVDWYDHQLLQWESKNIDLTSEYLVALEDLDIDEYYDVVASAECNCHNTLMVNPVEYYDYLIREFQMNVSGNKMYLTINNTQYSFTRYSSCKTISATLSTDQSAVSISEYSDFCVTVSASPHFAAESFTAKTSNASVVSIPTQTESAYQGSAQFVFDVLQAGHATITITENATGASITLSVTVEPPPPVSVNGIELDQSTLTVDRGSKATLTATIIPENAANQTVTWSSSDTSVVQVSNAGVVTAVANGEATITVTTEDGNYSDSCTVMVVNPPFTANCSIGWYFYISDYTEQGIKATVTASGGSGNYVYYDIKLYCANTLLAYTTDTTLNYVKTTWVANGTYTAIFTVRDSEGNEYSGKSTYVYERS